jgi:hypothetical protein
MMSLGDCQSREALLPRGRSSPHTSNLKIARTHEGEAIPARCDDEAVHKPSFAMDR